MVAILMQTFMNIIGVYYGKSEIFCRVHLQMAFELTPIFFDVTFGNTLIFREFFACMWLEIRDNLHTPSARWLAIIVCTFWQENRGGALIIESCPSSGSHKHSIHFPCIFEWVNIFFG